MDHNSFILGGFYAGTSIAVIAYLLNAVRGALAARGAKNRPYDTFGDAGHPRLTAAGVVHTSNQAARRAVGLIFLLVLFATLSLAGCYYILQS